MTVIPEDIAVELGRTVTRDSATWQQWNNWIEQVQRAITRRAERMGVDFASLDVGTVDDVTRWAVVRRISRPVDGAQSTTDSVQVDDGSVSKTRSYGQAQGDVHILDAWWTELGLVRRRRAFTIRPTGSPGYRP